MQRHSPGILVGLILVGVGIIAGSAGFSTYLQEIGAQPFRVDRQRDSSSEFTRWSKEFKNACIRRNEHILPSPEPVHTPLALTYSPTEACMRVMNEEVVRSFSDLTPFKDCTTDPLQTPAELGLQGTSDIVFYCPGGVQYCFYNLD